ncbi:MAG: hypothetical protein PHV32_11955, partial [Eubacteriales bacterium]|nr:hypothetical protein [Eubacteriales bacterium]
VYCPLNTQVSFTINFGTTKTIKALFYLPNTATWPGYSYSVWAPQFTRLLTDNTSPSISLSEQSYYSKSSVTISSSITDSESGVSLRKWSQGVQSSSYFTNNGTWFYSSFDVTSNGYYTVYSKDVAGNEAVKYINVTKMDTTPPVISASASTEWATSNTVTTNISDSQSGVSVQKYAYGNFTSTYFDTYGTTYTGNNFTVYGNGTYTVYAKDVVGNAVVQTITVSYVDNTVSVTHPVSVDYSINPNLSATFSASDIRLVNNSRIKVLVSVQELSSSTNGSLYFLNASPYTFSNWNTLNKTQSKIYIALGLRVKEITTSASSWYSINAYNPIYATDITSKILLGILNPKGASGCLVLSAKHGLAFDASYTARHNLVLVFETE